MRLALSEQQYSSLREEVDAGKEDVDLLKVSPVLFQASRILIMKILLTHAEASFKELKHDLELSDGNLASHLRALEKANYIICNKRLEGRRPITEFILTPEGKKAYQHFMGAIKKVVG